MYSVIRKLKLRDTMRLAKIGIFAALLFFGIPDSLNAWFGGAVMLPDTVSAEEGTEENTEEGILKVIISDEDTSEAEYLDYSEIYDSVLDEAESGIDDFAYYSIYDMDDDGILELIVQWGSTADGINNVWTCDGEGTVSFVGNFYLPQTLYTAPDYNGIYGVYGHMGHEIVTRITISDGELEEETISDREVEDIEDYYSNDMPLEIYEISDRQGLVDATTANSGIDFVEVYGVYAFDNGTDKTVDAEVGYASGDGVDYISLTATSYAGYNTAEFSGTLTWISDNTYTAEDYYSWTSLEITFDGEGMQVVVLYADTDADNAFEGYYEKTADLGIVG